MSKNGEGYIEERETIGWRLVWGGSWEVKYNMKWAKVIEAHAMPEQLPWLELQVSLCPLYIKDRFFLAKKEQEQG